MFSANMKEIIGKEMVTERDKLENRLQDLEGRLRTVEKAGATKNDKSKSDTLGTSYRKWNCYDLRQKLVKLNAKMEKHNANKSGKECGHRYECSCSGNKSAEKKVMAMKTSERLEQMAVFKTKGNTLYGQKVSGSNLASWLVSHPFVPQLGEHALCTDKRNTTNH